MKRILLFCAILALCASPASAAMTYGADYYITRLNRTQTSNKSVNPIYLFMNEVETALEGGGGVDSLVFTPGTEPSTASEGELYYDSASNGLLLYNGSSWVTIDTAGASSLDTAYNTGNTIDVDGSAVTLTTSDEDNNVVLALVQNEATNDNAAMTITMGSGATGSALTINSQTGGTDITGDNWSVNQAGTAAFATAGGTAVTVGSGDLTFTEPTTNDVYLLADGDGILTIGGTSMEDIDLNFATSNTLTLSSGTGTDTIAFGAVDSLTGVGAIAFDSAASSISLAATGAAQDLTIQVTGAQNSSLDLRSAGTGADAIKVYASAGGLDLDATNSTIVMTNTANGSADDFTIEVAGAQDSSLILQSAGTGGDALSLITSAATGDIKINSGDMIDIDAADDILIDLAGAAGEDILLTNTGGSITLSASEDATDAINIDATGGGIDIDATGEAGQDIILTNTGGSISLVATEAAADAIVLNASTAAGGIDITSNADIDITTTGASGEDITITNTGGSVAISATEDAQNVIHIEENGGTSGSINLYANQGTGASASTEHDASIQLQSDDGGISLYTTGNVANAVRIETNGGTSETINVSNVKGTGASSIDIDSTVGGITIAANAAGKDVDIDSVLGSIVIEAEEDAANALYLIADGGTSTTLEIFNDTGTSVTEGANAIQLLADVGGIGIESNADLDDAIYILLDGDTASEMTIQNDTGTTEDSIEIISDVGGIDITAATGKNMDLTAGQIALLSNEAAASAISLTTNTGAGETIVVTNTQGTGAGAIALESTAGGITAKVADEKNLQIGNNALDAYLIVAASGTANNEDIRLINTNGTNAKAIEILSSAGGVAIEGADEKDIYIGNDAADAYVMVAASATAGNEDVRVVNTNGTNAKAIEILASAGGVAIEVADEKAAYIGNDAKDVYFEVGASATAGDEDLRVINTNGTDEGAIVLTATAGGIDLNAAAAKDIALTGGQIDIDATHNTADAINLTTNAGSSETIRIINTQGTSVTEDAGAIQLSATAGGIQIQSDGNLDDAVVLRADGGTTAEMSIHNDRGTSESSIDIISDDGGIDITCATGKNMDLTGGQIALVSNENAASAISLTTNTGSTETIVVTNTQGTDPAAINLTASAGAITLTTGLASSGVLVNTSTYEHKIKYYPISQGVTAATEVIVGGGCGLVCTSLDAGVNEQGSTEGYAAVGDDEDILLFSIPLPDDFVDTGTQGDLIMEFDISEQAAEECNMDLRIFEYDDAANIAAIITDTVVADNDNTRGWKGLVTNSAGIGNEADLTAGDHLIIELTATADADDFFIYGMRLTYRVGLQATN